MKPSVTSGYLNHVIEPPLDSWPGLLRDAGAAHGQLPPQAQLPPAAHASAAMTLSAELRAAARRRLIEAAQQFVMRLSTLAAQAGLTLAARPLLTGDPDQQFIVMTGHQPVIFHPGLTFKYQTTQQFARQQQAICVAVVIDTDEGDGGQFAMPVSSEARHAIATGLPVMRLDSVSLSQGPCLYMNGRLLSEIHIQQLSQRVVAELQKFHADDAATLSQRVCDQYAALSAAGATMLEANLIVRWLHGIGGECLELPLSALSCFPEVLTLTASLLNQARQFAVHYNAQLDRFREEHAIRNEANPFPGMQITADTVELPLWVLHEQTSTREVLRVQEIAGRQLFFAGERQIGEGSAQLAGDPTGEHGMVSVDWLEHLMLQGIRLVPRGALITSYLRMLFSDLFVHGTGGGKYDRFTDTLIRSWWRIEPAPFAVASATRFLFPQAQQRLAELLQLSEQLRDLQFNPQRHFGSGIFAADLEDQLRELTDQKHAAIERMKHAHASGESAKDIGREIQRLTDQVKSTVTAAFASQLNELEQLSSSERSAISCRTFPWFLFAQGSI